jgi:hypothetical protein
MNALTLRRTVARVKSVREDRARRELRDRELAQAEAARQVAAAAAAEQGADAQRACAEQVLRQAWRQGGAAAELRALRSSLQRREAEFGEARSATAAAEQARDEASDEVAAAQGTVLAASKAHERAREAVCEARAEWRAGILKRQDLELDDRPVRRGAAAVFASCGKAAGKT